MGTNRNSIPASSTTIHHRPHDNIPKHTSLEIKMDLPDIAADIIYTFTEERNKRQDHGTSSLYIATLLLQPKQGRGGKCRRCENNVSNHRANIIDSISIVLRCREFDSHHAKSNK